MKSALNEWVRVPAIADRLGVSQGLVRDLIRRGRLPARRLGRIFLIRSEDLDQLVNDAGYTPTQRNRDE